MQRDFYDPMDANGEGAQLTRLALTIAPMDGTGTVGRPCHWAVINGIRLGDPDHPR